MTNANPLALTGRVTIAVNGAELDSMPGAKLRIGGIERKTITTDRRGRPVGKYVNAMVTCEVPPDKDTDLVEMSNWDNVTLTFKPDVGKSYILVNAWLEPNPEMTTGESPNIPLTFAANKADPV